MSRNIGNTDCAICNATVVLCGEPHPITPDEAGGYIRYFEGMIVADAVCMRCDAKYLAWVKRAKRMERSWMRDDYTRPFFDLSYRNSFNDEPADGDLPPRALSALSQRLDHEASEKL
jgi:hypothetical protein